MFRYLLFALLALSTPLSLAAANGPAAPGAAGPASAPAAPNGTSVPIPQPPSVEAHAYLLMDYDSGRILASSHGDDRVEPASLTKLMASYVVFVALKEGRLKLDESAPISEHAWHAEGSRSFVQVGTTVPVDILIKGMIVQSGNDATIALAERVGGTEPAFAQLMNEYARRLGMKSSHFEDSEGLPTPNHYTTARDMAVLARALIRDFPEYYHLYSLQEFTWNKITQHNRNGLLTRDPTVDGLKTGHTDSAGYCLVTSAKRGTMRLISVVMGAPSVKAREDASAALLSYGYTFFETVKVKSRGETVLKPRIYKSANEFAAVGTPADIYVTVARGEGAVLRTSVRTTDPLIAPLAAGSSVGELTVSAPNGEVVAKSPLVLLAAAPAGGVFTRLADSVALWFH